MGVMDWKFWRMFAGCLLVSLKLCTTEATDQTDLDRSDMTNIYTYGDYVIRKVRGGTNSGVGIENEMLKNLMTGMRDIKKGRRYLRKKSTNLLSEILAEKLNWRKSGSVTSR